MYQPKVKLIFLQPPFWLNPKIIVGFTGDTEVKNPPGNARDTGDMDFIPGSGRSRGGENGNPLQYSCLENPMDRGTWWAIVHGVAESQT